MTNKIPTWYWVVAVLMLLWNLMGLMAFVGQTYMTEEMIAALPQDQQDLFNNTPGFMSIAFAAAVIGGTLGCIGLLLRKKWAYYLFILSLIGVLFQNVYGWLATNVIEVYGTGQAIIMPLLVIAIAVFLIWHSQQSIKKGWLN